MSTKKVPVPGKTITLREDSQLNQKIIDLLEDLFLENPPKTLMKSMNFIFFQYLYYGHLDGYPDEFKYVAKDIYYLQNFFIGSAEVFKGK